MNRENIRDGVMTQIVKMLESGNTFSEVSYEILMQAQKYLKTTNMAIFQVSAREGMIGVLVECSQPGKKDIAMRAMPLKDCTICTDQLLYVRGDDADDRYQKIMSTLKLKTVVTMPISINDMKAMYFVVADTSSYIHFDDSRLQFIKDVGRVIQNIAQKKVTQNSLISSYEVLREILSCIGSGIMVCNKNDGVVFFQNEIAQQSDEVKRSILECLRNCMPNNDDKDLDEIPNKLFKKIIEHYDAESGLWFEIKIQEMKWIDESIVLVCTAMDITQKKKNQQRIEYQAHNDFLTGLYNRMKCEMDLRQIMEKTIKEKKKGAVLFIDLDNFKNINDGLGHQYGDILLQQIAAGLQSVPDLRGYCYRMGGDEFVIIVIPKFYDNLNKIVRNVVAMFNKPWYLMETEYFCTMSMGISIFPDQSKDVNEIVKLADIAMYEAKKSGKNGYTYYDDTKNNNTIKRLDIENNMRQAIATQLQEFVVYYQPVMDARTRKCTSCEALVRWNSKSLGFMGPGDFIPIAEYLGLITSIGDYVLEESCKQCKKWNDAGYPDFRINVNMSVVQLLQKNVAENISKVLKKTGVNPNNIILEITESFAINDMERVMSIITEIKKLGPRIALDDFGTGYSSLNYLKQLPLDLIKVDKTFIDDITKDEYAQAFIKLIVDLSKTIGTQIVVEGIEDIEQFELIKKLGVKFIQGYLFGKPVCAEQFERIHLGLNLSGNEENT